MMYKLEELEEESVKLAYTASKNDVLSSMASCSYI